MTGQSGRPRRAVPVLAVLAVLGLIGSVLGAGSSLGLSLASSPGTVAGSPAGSPATSSPGPTGATSEVGAVVPGPGGGVPAPAASDVTPTCGNPEPAQALGPADAPTGDPVQTVIGSTDVAGFEATSQGIYVFNSQDMDIYSLSGKAEGSFALPSAFTGSQNSAGTFGPFVDPSGNIWMASTYQNAVDEFSPTGHVLWSSTSYWAPQMFAFTNDGAFELGIVQSDADGTLLLNDSGQSVGQWSTKVAGFVSQEPDGDLLAAKGGYITTYDLTGTMLSSFGSGTGRDPTYSGSPYQFTVQAGAVEPTSGGPIYTLDPLNRIEITSTQGFLQGVTNVGGYLDVLESATNSPQRAGAVYAVNSTLYYVSGNVSSQSISSVPTSAVQQWADAPQSPLYTMGWGAGIASGPTAGSRVAGNYFPYGTSPTFYADFSSWWALDAPQLELSYSVWTAAEVLTDQYPTSTTVDLPTSAAQLAFMPLSIGAADDAPGPYELQVELLDTSQSPPELLGSTCAPFSVGAPGDTLDFSTLPPGAGYGGPTDPRGVVLNSELGLNGLRGASIDWNTYLPNCNPSVPTAATCGAAGMSFANAPQSYFQAAYLADQDSVTYWVQVATGTNMDLLLVKNSWWQQDVEAVVAYYSNASNCTGSHCAAVTNWEAWNEANNTYSANGGTYERNVLVPFYTAVKQAAPSDTVIGGSTLETDYGWWSQVVQAGGLNYMDVAGVHPYTGNNDSFEEDNEMAQVHQLQALLGSVPVWFTEIAWWSDGPYNFLAQANSVARCMLWQKALGVPVWNYFFDEGGWGDGGLSYSLIQDDETDDYVKPSALATMEAAQQFANRPFLSSPTVAIPEAYDMDFGPGPGQSTNLSAIWTDGLGDQSQITLTGGSSPLNVTITDQWGNATTYQLQPGQGYELDISDQVTYVTYPSTSTLSVQGAETYGTNLALSSSGATATASSSENGGTAADVITGNVWGNGWQPSGTDPAPTLTITLASSATIDRVVVDSHSLGSVLGSPRGFTLWAEEGAGNWQEIASPPVSIFYEHSTEVKFPAVQAMAVRIDVSVADYGGYYGGGIPNFWGASQLLQEQVHAVDVYGPGTSNAEPLPEGTPTTNT